MFLQHLHLRSFRNYSDQLVTFAAPKTILLGENAQGKSNLLEAVELLSTLRSHRVSRDRDLVQDNQDQGHITAFLQRDLGVFKLGLTLRASGRRTAMLNMETLRRQLDLLGTLNTVQFSALDLELVRGGPAQRRDWIDRLLVQLEPVAAHLLQQYGRVLRQRNVLLKGLGKAETDRAGGNGGSGLGSSLGGGSVESGEEGLEGWSEEDEEAGTIPSGNSQLAVWDAQLASLGTQVMRRRRRALNRLIPLAQRWHHQISGQQETLTVRYLPNVGAGVLEAVEIAGPGRENDRGIDDRSPGNRELDDRALDHPPTNHSEAKTREAKTHAAIDRLDDPTYLQGLFLEQIRDRSRAEQYQGTSLVGPHRDEVELLINDTPARHYGSQGQQRTVVLALKLAELELLETVIREPPVLLLDDVLAELDLKRQNQLLEAIDDRFQTLITTTHLGAFDSQWLKDSQILTVDSGTLLPQP
ncbi:MAG: DNA replication/repair protein RecF [Prochlorothrix sp.]